MPISDVLNPDGSDFDLFLQAEVGEDVTGAAVTVLSAFARLGLEPWAEARKLASLRCDAAQARMNEHLAAMSDIPSLRRADGSVAAKLISLLPKRAPRHASDLPAAPMYNGPRVSVFWMVMALFSVLALLRIYFLAHSG